MELSFTESTQEEKLSFVRGPDFDFLVIGKKAVERIEYFGSGVVAATTNPNPSLPSPLYKNSKNKIVLLYNCALAQFFVW